MVYVWRKKQLNIRPWKISAAPIERILKTIINLQPDSFMFGISDIIKSKDNRINQGVSLGYQPDMFLKKILPNDITIYDTTCWKDWAHDGTINRFIKYIKNKNVTVVGPSHLADFGKRVQLNKFNYIQINDREAALHTKDIAKKIKNIHNNKQYTVYLLQGGLAAIDLTTLLHGKIQNCCILDIGRAIDVYYYYDPIRKTFPRWYWGGWLDLNPPTWLLENKKGKKHG